MMSNWRAHHIFHAFFRTYRMTFYATIDVSARVRACAITSKCVRVCNSSAPFCVRCVALVCWWPRTRKLETRRRRRSNPISRFDCVKHMLHTLRIHWWRHTLHSTNTNLHAHTHTHTHNTCFVFFFLFFFCRFARITSDDTFDTRKIHIQKLNFEKIVHNYMCEGSTDMWMCRCMHAVRCVCVSSEPILPSRTLYWTQKTHDCAPLYSLDER